MPRFWPGLLIAMALSQLPSVYFWLTSWPDSPWNLLMFVWGGAVGWAVGRVRWWLWKRRHPPERILKDILDAHRRAAPFN